jgi:hypothetical protein
VYNAINLLYGIEKKVHFLQGIIPKYLYEKHMFECFSKASVSLTPGKAQNNPGKLPG